MKVCCTCKLPKECDEFSKNKTQKDGLHRACKLCEKNRRDKYTKEYKRECASRWRANNQEHWRKYRKRWYQENSWKWTEDARRRRKEDPYFRLIINLRGRIWHALKGKVKKDKTLNLLSCTPIELANHLEKQFQEGMSWENYGQWHVDHKLPVASFNLTSEEQQKVCFHYTNLQPLWGEDNRVKSDKLIS